MEFPRDNSTHSLPSVVGEDHEEELEMAEGNREPPRGHPILPRSIEDASELEIGDHILLQCTSSQYRKLFWSALVYERVEKNVHFIVVITNCENGVITKDVLISELHNLHRVEYSSCRYSKEESLEQALSRINENHYHPLRNNSHHFVSWCKTGQEHPLTDILRSLEYHLDDNCQINEKLHYVMLSTPVDDPCIIDPLHRGAHLLLERKHYLIESVDTQTKSFSAYSIDQEKKIKLYEGLTLKEVKMTKAEGDKLATKILVCTLHCGPAEKIEEALKRAKDELDKEKRRKWGSSDCFVTAMLCGTQHSVSEHYLVAHNVAPTGCTLITPKVTVEEGDHLVIKYVSNDWLSAIVLEYLDNTRVKIKPPLDGCEMIDLTTHPEIYRVNYSESILPAKEALKRAKSATGNEVLQKNLSDQGRFVTWAKIGREISVEISKFLKDMPTTEQRRVSYCRISSLKLNTVKPGDHLVECSPGKRRHFMLAECGDGTSVKIIVCSNTTINEESKLIDLSKEHDYELYRIEYTDELIATNERDCTLTDSVAVKKARSLLGKKMHNPWAPMLFITWAKTGAIEDFELMTPTMPISKSRIKSFDQLIPGDYLVVKPLSGWTHHYIVESVESPVMCTVIEHFYQGRVSETELTLGDPDKFPLYYRVNYEQGACLSNDYSVNQAKQYIGRTKLPGINYQNFVHFLKTEKKVKINIDDLNMLEQKPNTKKYLGTPLYIQSVSSPDLLTSGDHIVYRRYQQPFDSIYQSAIVIEILPNQEVQIATVMTDGFKIEELKFSFFHVSGLHRVVYHTCLSQTQVLAHVYSYCDKTEKYNYDEVHNNSHHFATRCKMGQEYPLTKLLTQLALTEMEQGTKILKPVLTKVPVESITDVHVGDHILMNDSHYLVCDVDAELKKIKTFTTTMHKVIHEVQISEIDDKISEKKLFCIKYDPYCDIAAEGVTIERAESEIQKNSKWQRSDQFVTMMKCGTAYIIDDSCLMSHEAGVVGSTKLTPWTSLDEGDHLVIEDMEDPNLYHSVLVCSFLNLASVVIIPSINNDSESKHRPEIIDLTPYILTGEVYRMNYRESLPPTEVTERACSQSGRNILQQNVEVKECSPFVTWAKTGREMQVDIQELIEVRQIEVSHPLEYKRIVAVNEFKVGQHIFFQWKLYKPFREHYLISECNVDARCPTKFRVICCLRMVVKEEEIDLNPNIPGNDIYEVIYQDELPPEIALKRARSLLGKIKPGPLARMWFVPWAKTGSEDGIEIDLFRNLTKPVSKSRIVCFTQLNIGDYVVEEKDRYFGAYHHYIVISIESPEKATVIESWNTDISEKVLDLSGRSASSENHPWFYRINYEDGICIPAEKSVEKAKAILHEPIKLPHLPFSPRARMSFVHYLKTGESDSIDISSLPDDRTLLPRELVKSAMDLKPGDHIERPLALAPSHAQHHMLVVEPIDDEFCKVIHYQVHPTLTELARMQKGKVAVETVNIFERDVCFRICYPERIDPEKGMIKLLQLCGDEGKKYLKDYTGKAEYSIVGNNCEHLVMIATLGFPVSIQVDKFIYQALQTGRGVVRSFRMSCLHHGVHLTPESSIHACHHVGINKLQHMQTYIMVHGIQQPPLSPTAAGSLSPSMSYNTMGVGGGSAGKASAKTAVKVGAKAAANGSVLGAVAGISFAVNVLVEAPLLTRKIYKLSRQRTFGKISDQEFKRRRDSAVISSVNSAIGGTLGAVVGQAAIPVPVLGAAVGGMIGNLAGYGCGQLEAKLFCQLVHPDQCGVTLPKIILKKLKSYDELASVDDSK